MKVLKSLKSFRPCKFISILGFLITIITYMSGVVANDEHSYTYVIDDFPTVKDFYHYLSALEKVVNFCERHKHYVDMNMQFGLFLIDGKILQKPFFIFYGNCADF